MEKMLRPFRLFIRAITTPQRRFNKWRYRPPTVRKFYASKTKARDKNRHKWKQKQGKKRNGQMHEIRNNDDKSIAERRKQIEEIEEIVCKQNNPCRNRAYRV